MEQTQKKSVEAASGNTSSLHLMDKLRSWQDNARDAVSAVRHDYREMSHGMKQVAKEFQEKSEVMAYFRERADNRSVRLQKPSGQRDDAAKAESRKGKVGEPARTVAEDAQ